MPNLERVVETIRFWTQNPIRCWFTKCDICGKRYLFGKLYELYYEQHYWCWACQTCTVSVLTKRLEKYLVKERKCQE